MSSKNLNGLNIQFPISRLILSGEKSVETRFYPLPQKYIGKEMVLIETPGKIGKFKARYLALVCFKNCFEYESKMHFRGDYQRHRVEENSDWDWQSRKRKWGWEIDYIVPLTKMKLAPTRRGLVFCSNLKV